MQHDSGRIDPQSRLNFQCDQISLFRRSALSHVCTQSKSGFSWFYTASGPLNRETHLRFVGNSHRKHDSLQVVSSTAGSTRSQATHAMLSMRQVQMHEGATQPRNHTATATRHYHAFYRVTYRVCTPTQNRNVLADSHGSHRVGKLSH